MTLTWGQIDAARELEISRWDWNHQWTQLTKMGVLSRCVRCDAVNRETSEYSKCRGDTPEQARAHMDLF